MKNTCKALYKEISRRLEGNESDQVFLNPSDFCAEWHKFNCDDYTITHLKELSGRRSVLRNEIQILEMQKDNAVSLFFEDFQIDVLTQKPSDKKIRKLMEGINTVFDLTDKIYEKLDIDGSIVKLSETIANYKVNSKEVKVAQDNEINDLAYNVENRLEDHKTYSLKMNEVLIRMRDKLFNEVDEYMISASRSREDEAENWQAKQKDLQESILSILSGFQSEINKRDKESTKYLNLMAQNTEIDILVGKTCKSFDSHTHDEL